MAAKKGIIPIYKFNNGNGAMLCNFCRTIISTGKATEELYCDKCKPIIKIIQESKEGRINLRGDGRVEWVCDHGVGHTIYNPNDLGKYSMVHGCDGCCSELKL